MNELGRFLDYITSIPLIQRDKSSVAAEHSNTSKLKQLTVVGC